jgi:phenylacetate-CoA ligase
VAEIARRHPEILKARLVVTGEMANDAMTLRCEVADPDAPSDLLIDSIRDSIRDVSKLRGEVQFVARASLPNDGKVIEDARKYE